MNIRVTPTSATSAIARWDPPHKNPQVVELYRILWRPVGSGRAYKIDTSHNSYTIGMVTKGGVLKGIYIKRHICKKAYMLKSLSFPFLLKFVLAD